MVGFLLVPAGAINPGLTCLPTLDELRRLGQRYTLLHAYHRLPGDYDGDLYLRLGLVHGSTPQKAAHASLAVRRCLSASGPFELSLQAADFARLVYVDECLPLETTRMFPLVVAQGRLSARI